MKTSRVLREECQYALEHATVHNIQLISKYHYYKLLTVCEWNDLNILKHFFHTKSSKHLPFLQIKWDYWDDRFFSLLYGSLLEEGSNCHPSLCCKPGFLPWKPLCFAYGCPYLDLWSWTCPGTHSCFGPQLDSGKDLAVLYLEEVGSHWSCVIHFFSGTSWFCPL